MGFDPIEPDIFHDCLKEVLGDNASVIVQARLGESRVHFASSFPGNSAR